jgi:hypothetical protein
MLTRQRFYNDVLQHLDVAPPIEAPQWCCTEQENDGNVIYDTDIGYDSSIYDEYMYDATMEED